MQEYNLYFDEVKHKYYDDFSNPFTSVTTILKKYETEKDWKEVARNCWKAGLRGNPKYVGKSVEQLLREWGKTSEIALEQGNEKHGFLEVCVKDSTQFYNFHKRHPGNNRRLYTVPEIIQHPGYGELFIEDFINTGIKERYPDIFYVITTLVKAGYRIYSECGVYNIQLLVSGLIDIIFIKGKRFIILDWKTNKSKIRFDAGYYEKDIFGNLTDRWIATDDKFKNPLGHLACSSGNIYGVQLGTYAWLAIQFGLELETLILCQIIQKFDNEGNKTREETHIDQYPVLLEEAESMLRHHITTIKRNTQHSLMLF